MLTQKHYPGEKKAKKGETGMDVTSIVMILILLFLLVDQKNSNDPKGR